MKKFFSYLIFFIVGNGLTACSDHDDGLDSPNSLEIYGRQYQLSEGVIWENNPYSIVSKSPYVYEDVYYNDEGEKITDKVNGFTVGKDIQNYGNFMLSFYEEGLSYNSELQSSVGTAACVCFHLVSSDTKEIKPGEYKYDTTKKEGSFTGYASSLFSTNREPKPAELSEGTINVEKNNDIYSVAFTGKTTFGGEVFGHYKGNLRMVKVPQLESASFESIKLAGLLESVRTIVEIPAYGMKDESVGYDEGNGAAFFSTSSGVTLFANTSSKESANIALVWDQKTSSFFFESPIRMRSYIGHNKDFDFPCHTCYMKAPASFTDQDFENLNENSFAFEIKDEKVMIPTKNFKPVYVFFQGGDGTRGVIKVKDYTPASVQTECLFDFLYTTFTVNPMLTIDIKCPASFTNPKIR